MSDLIYREAKGDKADASALSQIVRFESILGAPYSVVTGSSAAKRVDRADGHFGGVEAMLPIALRNVLKGTRYATEGANTLRGDPVMEVTCLATTPRCRCLALPPLTCYASTNSMPTARSSRLADKQDNLVTVLHCHPRGRP